MPDKCFGGLDFGSSGARISIINFKKELIYSNSVKYKYGFKNLNSWIHSCEILLDSLPLDIKSTITNLAISGTSGTLAACDLKGNPLGQAIPYDQVCDDNKILIKATSYGEEHLQTPYSSLSKALKLIDKCKK